MIIRTRWALACAPVVSALMLSACTGQSSGSDEAVAVTSTNDTCEVSQNSAPAGTVTFSVTNTGTEATEFYVYEGDGTTIVGEVENVGPGLTRDLVATLTPGTYVTACNPGMNGEDLRAEFTATDAAPSSQPGAA